MIGTLCVYFQTKANESKIEIFPSIATICFVAVVKREAMKWQFCFSSVNAESRDHFFISVKL